MKITKFGHCCLLLEIKGTRILTDPGEFSTLQNEVQNLHIVLITHEHADHLHVESLKTVLQNNPNAKVITNSSVGKILTQEGIEFTKVEEGESHIQNDVLFEGFGKDHATVYGNMPQMLNTGYFLDNNFFYPGDAFTNPGKPVKLLALPVEGPWMRSSESIDYALEINPVQCIPVHDGRLKNPEMAASWPKRILEEKGIKFSSLEIGKTYEFNLE